jgi:enterochelin esterase-like enzyme
VAPIDEETSENGRAERVREPAHSDQIAGDLVTETFEYDGGRKVTVYLPPSSPQAVVFCGDGQLITRWAENLEGADVPPTMIVGAHRIESEDETLRLSEYSPAFDAARFAAHERFFVHDVREWVQSKFGIMLPADRTVVAGVSASAEFSLAMGLRHPELYSTVFAASPGAGYRPPRVMPSALPRAYLTAGTLEPFFLNNAIRWAEALRAAGADIVMSERVGDHGDAFWQAEFVKMVAWAFGR